MLPKRSTTPINVACGLIRDHRGRFLISQRLATQKLPLKWEFPGGKFEEGETAASCLVRELREELGIEVAVKLEPYHTQEVEFPHGKFHLTYLECWLLPGVEPQTLECQAFEFVEPEDLVRYDFLPADVELAKQIVKTLPKTLFTVGLIVEDSFSDNRQTAFTEEELVDSVEQAMCNLDLIVQQIHVTKGVTTWSPNLFIRDLKKNPIQSC